MNAYFSICRSSLKFNMSGTAYSFPIHVPKWT